MDLYAALRYAGNDDKTDKKMHVSAINCPAKRAYERMMATKRRYGKLDGNVAYHGYQSFQTGEVTPEEAHKIGLETAKRMWGEDYEIVVTTHLTTDNLHNHFVVNSVSFKTGRKFENHISDHYQLREISDAVCLEYSKSILKEADFYGGEKQEYWLKKQGNMTHRELLKADIDTALAQSTNFKAFEIRLKDMGYEIIRDERFAHYSVKAPDWQRAIRIDRLGKEYTPQAIWERLLDNQRYVGYIPFQKPKYTPLLSFEIEYRKMKRMDGIQILFTLVIELCRLITGNNVTKDTPRPLSAALDIYKNNNESLRTVIFDDIEIALSDSLAFQRIYEENKKLCTNINQSLSSSARMIEFCTIESNINDVETTLKPIRKMRSMISFVFTLMSVLTTGIFILTLVIILRKRKKEIAILISLGEKKSMIIFQFVFETVFLCLIGLILASLVSQILTPILIRQMIDANLSYQKELSRIGNILKNIDYQTQKQQPLESYQNSSRFGLFLFSFGIVSILSSIPSAFLMSFFVSQHLRKLYQQEE